jgi:hypothetical protein
MLLKTDTEKAIYIELSFDSAGINIVNKEEM